MFVHLASDADNEYAMIDSTIARAPRHITEDVAVEVAGDVKKIRTRQAAEAKKVSPKIHATDDAFGNSTTFHLIGSLARDLAGADVLLPDLRAATILADKGYDAAVRILEPLARAGKTAVVPPRRSQKDRGLYDKHLYRARHLIENFFDTLKQFRVTATRYGKTACTFLAAMHLVDASI